MRIAAEEPLQTYLQSDGYSGTTHFWENTFLGQMIPFSTLAYVNLSTNQQSETYQPGFTGIYAKNIKFPQNGDGPFKLAYSSASLDRERVGPITTVLIYEVNKDYQPSASRPIVSQDSEVAIVSIFMGEFTIEFKNEPQFKYCREL